MAAFRLGFRDGRSGQQTYLEPEAFDAMESYAMGWKLGTVTRAIGHLASLLIALGLLWLATVVVSVVMQARR